jgi:hypothetical protein
MVTMKAKTSSPDAPRHKYTFEQLVEVVSDGKYPPVVQIMALIDGHVCSKHSAPYYGCSAGNDHFTLCEGMLKPCNKRKMN